MINQLRKIYSSLLVYSERKDNLDRTYKWFVTDDNEIIGISEEELTSKDLSLLTTFLLPYNINLPLPTAEEQKWRNTVHSTEVNSNFEIKNPYRFIYFSIKKIKLTQLYLKMPFMNYLQIQFLFYGKMDMKGLS